MKNIEVEVLLACIIIGLIAKIALRHYPQIENYVLWLIYPLAVIGLFLAGLVGYLWAKDAREKNKKNR